MSMASVLVMLTMLTGCPHPPPEMITISGVVSDDIVVGATVQVKSLTTGAQLATATTNSAGAFAANVPQTAKADGISLSASGGKMLGEPFVGTMTALYPPALSYEQANVTLLTTALEKAVGNSADGAARVERLKRVTTLSLAGGVLPVDFSSVAPSGPVYASLKSDADRLAVEGSTSRFAASIEAQVTASNSSSGCDDPPNGLRRVCWKTVGVAGADFLDAAGTNVVHIPAGHFSEPAGSSSCAWKVIVETAPHSIVLRLATAFNGGGSLTPCTLSSAEDIDISLSLPADTLRPLLDCDGSNQHAAMTTCETSNANIEARYHMASGPVSRSYVGGNPRALRSVRVASASPQALPDDRSLLLARLEREFASQLFSSVPRTAPEQWSDRTAVIFVNGYTPGGGFGGGTGTWGQLPSLVAGPAFPDVARFVALNFQWSTDGNFFATAADLAKAVDYAHLKTNKPVHIVAHSFGGVLARVFLQNIDEAMTGVPGVGWSQSASKVASLTTIGTPHSGIANKMNGAGEFAGRRLVTVRSNPLVSAYLPFGWAPAGAELAVAGVGCFQVSCYQAGLSNASVAPFAIADIQKSADPVVPGYVAARLYLTRNDLPQGLKILALIGQQRNNLTAKFTNGDGLISYLGQRYLPDQQPNVNGPVQDPLPFPIRLGDAYVTERLLGLNVGEPAYEGKDATGIAGHDGFGNGLSGYAHSGLVRDINLGRVREVEIACPDSSTCTHDTWLNIRALLLSLLGGPASDNFPANIGAATCTPAIAGQGVTCTLTGGNIPATNFLLATNCGPTSMAVVPNGSPNRRQFTCTAGAANSVISFSYSADPINGLGAANTPPRPASLTVSPSIAVATVTRVECTAPVVNQPMICTVSGTNLPMGIVLAATNCSPLVMTLQSGGSATERRFSCTPTLQGNLGITQLSVPGFVGALPTLPSYYTVDSVAAATKLIYVSDSVGVLAAVDVVGLKVYVVGTMTPAMEDIAFSPSGELYGVTPTSLYRINPGTAATSFVGGNFATMVGLGFSPEGILYGVGGTKLYSIDTSNGNATLIGDTGHVAAGDIAFDSLGAMYFSTTLNQLVRLNRSTGASTVVGNLGYSNVWGLALARNEVLYGFSGINALTVNAMTGIGTQAFFFTGIGLGNIAGATTRP